MPIYVIKGDFLIKGNFSKMNKINEDVVVPIVIDFEAYRSGEMNESFLRSFAAGIKMLLSGLLDGISIPVSVRGTKSDIKTFTAAIGAEKDYISAFRKYGLDNPATYRMRSVLDQKVSKFERATGLKWPFK